MKPKTKDQLQAAGVCVIMAGSIITVVLVAWLSDGRDEPREYPPAASVAQAE